MMANLNIPDCIGRGGCVSNSKRPLLVSFARFPRLLPMLAFLFVTVLVDARLACCDSLDANSCTASSFPSSETATWLTTNGSRSVDHQEYAVSVFKLMDQAVDKCKNGSAFTDPSAGGGDVRYVGVDKVIFSGDAQSQFANQEEQFGFNNARTLVNLMAAAPPRAPVGTISASKAAYCQEESCPAPGTGAASCECTDCNIWFNDVFLDTLLQTAVESHANILASGMCWRKSRRTAECRDVTDVGNLPISKTRTVNIGSCSEPWLWRQPAKAFENYTASANFTLEREVNLVPQTGPQVTSGTYRYDNVTIPHMEESLISWSTVHAMCRRNMPSVEWVHLLTIPLVAICSERLATLGMCNVSTSDGKVVMVGSAWTAVSLQGYSIDQCGDKTAEQEQHDNVFIGSSLCNRVQVTTSVNGSTYNSLKCQGSPKGFTPDMNYICTCPDGTYINQHSATTGTSSNGYSRLEVERLALNSLGRVQDAYVNGSFCSKCELGCRTCQDSTPCLRENDRRLRTPLLVLTLLTMIGMVVIIAVLYKYWDSQIIMSSVGEYLVAILLSALLAYVEAVVLFPVLNDTICAIQPWPRHVAFMLIFGFLFAKVWRVQILARVAPGSISPGHLDRTIVSCVMFLAGFMIIFLVVWTTVAAPTVIIAYDSIDNSYEVCRVDAWRYTIHGLEVLLLVLACVFARRTRQLVLEWPEFKFITLPFLNAAIIKSLIAIFYFTLMPDKYADHLYLLQFFEMHFTITSLVAVLCGHKLYFLVRGKLSRDVGPTVPLKPANPNPSPPVGVDPSYMDSYMSNTSERRDSVFAEVCSITDYQQPKQQLQVHPPAQQESDGSQTAPPPSTLSLREVLFGCFSSPPSGNSWNPTAGSPDGEPNVSPHQSIDRSGSNGGDVLCESPTPTPIIDETRPPPPSGTRRKLSSASVTFTQDVTNSKTNGSGVHKTLNGGMYGGFREDELIKPPLAPGTKSKLPLQETSL